MVLCPWSRALELAHRRTSDPVPQPEMQRLPVHPVWHDAPKTIDGKIVYVKIWDFLEN